MNLYGFFVGSALELEVLAVSLRDAHREVVHRRGYIFKQGMKIEPILLDWCER